MTFYPHIGLVFLSGLFAVASLGCDAKKTAPLDAKPVPSAAAASPPVAAAMDNVASLENANDTKKLFADPSITKHPAKDLVYGNGQTLSIEYDGSKSKAGESVFFDLTMIRPDGIVVQVGSDTFDGKTPGTAFSKANKVFNSDVQGRSGFVEINIVQNSGLDDKGKISGKNVMIGRFPIKLEASK
jgi:hypothetical protein